MRDLLTISLSLFLQREGAEDILDFWLDVQQHENLCRAYFKDVRKSGKTIREDWPQYWEYARRRGSIYGTVVGLGGVQGQGVGSNPMGTKRSTASTGVNDGIPDHEKARLASFEDEKGGRSLSPNMAYGRANSPTSPEMQEPRSSTPFSITEK